MIEIKEEKDRPEEEQEFWKNLEDRLTENLPDPEPSPDGAAGSRQADPGDTEPASEKDMLTDREKLEEMAVNLLRESMDQADTGRAETDQAKMEQAVTLQVETVIPRNSGKTRKNRGGKRRSSGTRRNQSGESGTATSAFSEYKEKLLAYRKKKWFRGLLIALLVLIVTLIIALTVRNWKYTSYTSIVTDAKEDTLSFDYCRVGDQILKYGVDSASLTDRDNRVIWNVSYTMNAPAVAVCQDTAAIYDKNGTGIVICDQSGQIGSVSANMPIVKAEVAKQGVVAAILEDGENAWIQYYDQTGAMISTIKTTVDTPGYPMDLGLSEDGMLMAVSYLYFENGMPKTRLYFYNFGNVGQNQMDNRVSSFEYNDLLMPQVDYLDGSTCVAFREDGFTLFGGSQIPEVKKEITVNQEIVSIFHDDSYIGMILENEDGGSAFLLEVYDKNGREVLSREVDFPYQNIEIADRQVVLSNRSGFCVYALSGVEKFNGSLKGLAQEFFSIGKNRYVFITEDSFNIIKLG